MDLQNPSSEREIAIAAHRSHVWKWLAEQGWVKSVDKFPKVGLFWFSRNEQGDLFMVHLPCDIRSDGQDFGEYILPPGDPHLFWDEVRLQVSQWTDVSEAKVQSGRVFFDKQAWNFGVFVPQGSMQDDILKERVCAIFDLPPTFTRFVAW